MTQDRFSLNRPTTPSRPIGAAIRWPMRSLLLLALALIAYQRGFLNTHPATLVLLVAWAALLPFLVRFLVRGLGGSLRRTRVRPVMQRLAQWAVALLVVATFAVVAARLLLR